VPRNISFEASIVKTAKLTGHVGEKMTNHEEKKDPIRSKLQKEAGKTGIGDARGIRPQRGSPVPRIKGKKKKKGLGTNKERK